MGSRVRLPPQKLTQPVLNFRKNIHVALGKELFCRQRCHRGHTTVLYRPDSRSYTLWTPRD